MVHRLYFGALDNILIPFHQWYNIHGPNHILYHVLDIRNNDGIYYLSLQFHLITYRNLSIFHFHQMT